MDDLIYASASTLARAIRAKEVSSLEVVDACLSRIDAVNPKLNAVVQLTADSARQQAREADAALARGEVKGALHGVPMTIKDSFDTAGVISTGGTLGRANFVPDQDATVVARLRGAGAILLGKTNTPELTFSFETDNRVYGQTRNPYDLERTPGGSSGGAVAMIAAGGTPFDIGTDTGGSIRLPAHFSGVAGIKPTFGRVPRTGHIVSYDVGALDSLTHVGPLARRVEDLVLILPIIAGADWRDPSVVPMPLGDPAAVDVNALRVAFHTDNGIVTPAPEIVSTVQDVARALADGGLTVQEERPPMIEQTCAIMDPLFGADTSWIRAQLERAGTTAETVGRFLTWTFNPEAGGVRATVDFLALTSRWALYRSAMLGFMEHYDVMISPVNPFVAHRISEGSAHRDAYSYTYTHNLTGFPAAVVRCGTSPEGLPIGVQIVARPWREDVALAVAQQLEMVFGGWQRPPL